MQLHKARRCRHPPDRRLAHQIIQSDLHGGNKAEPCRGVALCPHVLEAQQPRPCIPVSGFGTPSLATPHWLPCQPPNLNHPYNATSTPGTSHPRATTPFFDRPTVVSVPLRSGETLGSTRPCIAASSGVVYERQFRNIMVEYW